MRFIRKAACGIAAVLGSGVLLYASPASVSADTYTCDGGEVCLYENNTWNEGSTNHCKQWWASTGDSNFSNNTWLDCTAHDTTTDGMNDETSSMKNRSSIYAVTLWQHANYTGASSLFASGVSDAYLANNAIGDNRASSVYTP